MFIENDNYYIAEQPKQEATFQFNCDNIALLTGENNYQLSRLIAQNLACPIERPVALFPDGETNVKIEQNLRNKDVVIIQSTSYPQNSSWMDLYLMCDAARRGSARSISTVIPYFGYSRQDRKARPRVPISGKVVAEFLETIGADRVMTCHIHAPQTQGFVDIPWDDLPASYLFLPVIKSWGVENLVMVAPDEGSLKINRKFADRLDARIASLYKERNSETGKTETAGLMGSVAGLDCVLFDDIAGSGGTLVDGAKILLEEGGARSVRAMVTHGVLYGDAKKRLYDSPIKEIVITDTIRQTFPAHMLDKFKIVSAAPMFAHAIAMNFTGESLSQNFFMN